jgi:hypothetical protein
MVSLLAERWLNFYYTANLSGAGICATSLMKQASNQQQMTFSCGIAAQP